MVSAASTALAPLRRRTALVVGVANGRSIAWACARSLIRGGYDVVTTYQSERFRAAVEGLADRENGAAREATAAARATVAGSPAPGRVVGCLPCDVSDEDSVRELFEAYLPPLMMVPPPDWEEAVTLSPIEERGGTTATTTTTGRGGPRLDALIHCVAHAPPTAMKGGTLLGTGQDDFAAAHSISSYSLVSLARHGLPLLSSAPPSDTDREDANGGGLIGSDSAPSSSSSPPPPSSSIVALTYLGSSRAVPNYNVMGPAKASLESAVRGLALELGPPPHRVRVNAVSAGPVGTLAARGIRGFTDMREDAGRRSMLRRNVTAEEVGEVVAFLAGEGSSGVTGQTVYVDGGYGAVAGPAFG